VIPDDVDEHALLSREREALRLSPHVVNLTICPTIDFNFGCPDCFEGDAKPQERMNEGTMGAVVRFVQHLRTDSTHRLSVTWFGGEPLLGLPQIERLTDRLRPDILTPYQWSYGANIITNGYGLTRKIAEKLQALDVSGAQVTLDGLAHHHDARRFRKGRHPTFARILANIEEAADLIRITIRVNIDRSNQEDYFPLVEELKRRDLRGKVGLYPAFTRDDGDTSLASAYQSAHEFVQGHIALHRQGLEHGLYVLHYRKAVRLFCGSSSPFWWTIARNGDLHKCWDTVNEPSAAVGNVEDLGPTGACDTWWTKWSPFQHDKCRSCPVMPLCMGGCARNALMQNGVPQCEQWKTGLNDTIKVWVEDRRKGAIPTTAGRVPIGDSV